MAEIRAVVPTDRREEVVRSIHEQGRVQLESVDEELVTELDLERESAPGELGEISSLTMEIDRIIEVLEKPPDPPLSRMDEIRGYWNEFFTYGGEEKRKFDIESREEAVEVGEDLVDEPGSEVKELNERLESSRNRISDFEDKIDSLKALERFGLEDLEVLESSEFTFSEAGMVPNENLEDIEEEMREEIGVDFVFLSRLVDEGEAAVCIWTLAGDEGDAREVLSFYGFESLNLPDLEGEPGEVREDLERKLKEARDEEGEILDQIREISRENKKDFLAVREVLEIEEERAGAVGNFSRTDTATVVQGWAPKGEAGEIEETIMSASGGMGKVEFSNPGNPENDPPTLLENPPILERFEVLTKLFGIPGEGEIDPTPLLAFTYVIFFGVMLTDAAYGFFLLLVSVGLYRGAGMRNETMRDFATIMILGSLAAIIAGVVTGSYFGDLLTEYIDLASYLPVKDLTPYDPIENPMPLLLVSVFTGIFHESLGIGIGVWEKANRGSWGKAIGDGVSWLLLIPGSIILISQGFGWISFGMPLLVAGGFMTVLSIALIIFDQGPMGIMNMFSMLGNIMSYTRIMALALVTSSLALTFNAVASLGWGVPVIGFIISAVIFLSGQVFSLAMNIISSFVHSLRLHFVEFFDKFYRGRGTEFKPFKTERVHTRG